MTTKEMNETITERKWGLQTNIFGLWIVGPEDENGTMNILGMGRTREEALEMAMRSNK